MSDCDETKETIELGGVRFSADEITSVKLNRDGCEINVEPKKVKTFGFKSGSNADEE